MPRIAVILPKEKPDYLANTVLDGLIDLGIDYRATEGYPAPFAISTLSEGDFIQYAAEADLVILCWGKNSTNYALAEKINRWDKTVYVDGSELGKNNRFDKEIERQVKEMTYPYHGAIDKEMLAKCKRYFRREKPYVSGILPFPFGIERRYIHARNEMQKDIDLVCIFGQEDYPPMRKEVRKIVEKSKLKTATKKTGGFTFNDDTKVAGRNEFYDLLARARAGVSVGGGGYDTARFWEILANNCALYTEKIDIEIPGWKTYRRVVEFTDAHDFQEKIAMPFPALDNDEYTDILENHSTKARVRYLLDNSL